MRNRDEVKSIIPELCSGLKPLFPQSRVEAILFSSYARGDAHAESDIDVMVSVDSPRLEISKKPGISPAWPPTSFLNMA